MPPSNDNLAGQQPHQSNASAWPRVLVPCEETGGLRLKDRHRPLLIEVLARIAAQLAGRDPDERVKIVYEGQAAFDGEMWRYPDFVQRAEKAFGALAD